MECRMAIFISLLGCQEVWGFLILFVFFSPSWSVPGGNIFPVRLLCDRVRTLRVHSLAVVPNCSSTEMLISYPEKLLTIVLEILILEKWMQFQQRRIKKNFWCSLVYFLLPSFSKRGNTRFDRSSGLIFLYVSPCFFQPSKCREASLLSRGCWQEQTVQSVLPATEPCERAVVEVLVTVLDKVYSLFTGWHCGVV